MPSSRPNSTCPARGPSSRLSTSSYTAVYRSASSWSLCRCGTRGSSTGASGRCGWRRRPRAWRRGGGTWRRSMTYLPFTRGGCCSPKRRDRRSTIGDRKQTIGDRRHDRFSTPTHLRCCCYRARLLARQAVLDAHMLRRRKAAPVRWVFISTDVRPPVAPTRRSLALRASLVCQGRTPTRLDRTDTQTYTHTHIVVVFPRSQSTSVVSQSSISSSASISL